MQPKIDALGHEDLYIRLQTGTAMIQAHALEALVSGLKHDDIEVRWRAAAVLGLLGDKQAVDALIHVLSDESYDVRHSVVWALGMLGDMRAFEPLVRIVLHDFDEEIAVVGAFALLELNEERAVELLRPELSDPNKRTYRTAKTALNRLNYRDVD